MAKTALIFSGYWFPNWIRVSLWQNSNKVKGQDMIHKCLELIPMTASDAHSFNTYWLRSYCGPGLASCQSTQYNCIPDVRITGWIGRKGSMNFGICSNLLSCLPQEKSLSGNYWGDLKWQMTWKGILRLASPCAWVSRGTYQPMMLADSLWNCSGRICFMRFWEIWGALWVFLLKCSQQIFLQNWPWDVYFKKRILVDFTFFQLSCLDFCN